MRAGDWKIVHHRRRADPRRPTEQAGFQLYNLRQDPSEKTDLSASNPAEFAAMKQRLARYRQAMVPSLGGSGPMPKGKRPQRWGHPDKQ